MPNKILELLALIGGLTVAIILKEMISDLWEKFNRWRRNGCKIKWLCKPHMYRFDSCWPNSGELYLRCKKCGKRKKIYIDTESFKGIFTGGAIWTQMKP